jgi:glycosyltransferase involved in cell wall biosynthesis
MNSFDRIVFRIVTSNYCVSTHLKNTLLRIPHNIKLIVLGDNVEIFSNEYKNVIFIDIPLKRNFHLIFDVYSIFLISLYILKYRPNVIHSLMTKAGFYGSILSFIFNIRVRVHTFTGQVWANSSGIKKVLLKIVDKIICALNTHCFTDSKSQSEFLYVNGISHKGKVIPYILNGSISGVDLVEFNPKKLNVEKITIKNNLKINDDDFVIGYIARKSVEKGSIDMLEIFCGVLKKIQNRKVKLLFIGPDESNGLLEAFFKKNPQIKNYIIELGFVNHHHHYISVCNLMCLPSHREGFGSIVIDSAAMGVPTIGYKIPGLVDSISSNFSGELIPFLDIDYFTEVIIDLINDNDRILQMSKNARIYASKFFCADKVNEELFKFYLNS